MGILATDTFTGSNGTSLSAHTMDVGSGWTLQQGSWDLQGNQANLVATAGDDQNVATCDPGSADVAFEAQLITPASGHIDAGVVFNFSDNSNYWLLAVTRRTDLTIHGWFLYERNAGSFTLRASETASGLPAQNTTYTIRIITRGDAIGVMIDGAVRLGYSVSARPFKTATKVGLRIYKSAGDPDGGSRFDNLEVTTGRPKYPTELFFALTGSIHTSVNPFDDEQFVDAFGSNTIANYSQYTGSPFSGTSSIGISGGSATWSGAAAGGLGLQPLGETLLAPYVYIELDVTSVSAVNDVVPFCGFLSDSDDRVWAFVFQGGVGIETWNNGSGVSTPTQYGSFTPPYKLCCVLCYPECWAWVDTGSGYTAIAQVLMNMGSDIRELSKFSTSWLPIFGMDRLAAGASGVANGVRVGYVGGAPGVRDAKPVTYADGRPYLLNGNPLVAATMATGDDYRTNHMAIVQVDVSDPDTPVPSVLSHLFYRIASTDLDNPSATKDKCTALYGGQVMRNADNTGWEIITNGWGYQHILTDGIDLFRATTNANLLAGAHALDAYQLAPSGTTKSVYDNGQRWDGTTLKLATAETIDRLLDPSGAYHLAYFEGSDADNLAFVRRDTARTHAEQALFVRINGTWFIIGGGDGGPHWWNADLSVYGGSLFTNIDFGGASVAFPPGGCCIIPVNRGANTQYIAVMFSSDQLTVNGNLCDATTGRWFVVSSQEVENNEFRYGSLLPRLNSAARAMRPLLVR